MDAQDYIGQAGDQTTQGLGRLAAQYCNSPKLQALLAGVLAMANDLDLLFSRVQRIMSPLDDVMYDPGAAGVYPVNAQGAKTFQLLVIGNVVGVTNVVPAAGTATGPQTLTDAQFLKLINARIYRNFVKGCTIPQLLYSLQLIMPDRTGAGDIVIEEIGFMTTMVIVNRAVANWEAGICAIPAGHNPIKGGILPRPMGVSLLTWWRDAGSFTFATEEDLTVLVDPTGVGFNTTESFTSGIGHWPEDF